MALKAVAGGGGLIGSAGAFSIQLSNDAGAVVDGVYYVTLLAPFDLTITGGAYTVDSGSFDMELLIDTVLVVGSDNTVSGVGSYTCTADNQAMAGSEIRLVVSASTGNPPNANVQITFTRDSV